MNLRTASLLSAMAITVSGCVSKSTAKAQSQAAFAAGQQQGMMNAMQMNRGPNISVVGPVQNGQINWNDGLTLSQVLVSAGYQGRRDPAEIVVLRKGQAISINVKDLLAGQDFPMEQGDLVQIRP